MASPFGIYPGALNVTSGYLDPSRPRLRAAPAAESPSMLPSPGYVDQMNRVGEASDYRRSRQLNLDNSVRRNKGRPLLPDGSGTPTYLVGGGSGHGGVAEIPPGGNILPMTPPKPPPEFDEGKWLLGAAKAFANDEAIHKGLADASARHDTYVKQYYPGAGTAPAVTASGGANGTVTSNNHGMLPGGATTQPTMTDEAVASYHNIAGQQPTTQPAAQRNKIEVTDQQAREMWRNVRSQYGSDAEALPAFHDLMSKHYGINGNALQKSWADGGTLNQQHYDVTPGLRVPVSMLGTNNGMDAGQNGRIRAPESGSTTPPSPNEINAFGGPSPFLPPMPGQATPGPSIQAPSTYTERPAPGYTPLGPQFAMGYAAPAPSKGTNFAVNRYAPSPATQPTSQPTTQPATQPSMTDAAVASYRGVAKQQTATRPDTQPTARAQKPVTRPTTQAANDPASAGVPIHVNPQTGQRIRWNGSAWEEVAANRGQ